MRQPYRRKIMRARHVLFLAKPPRVLLQVDVMNQQHTIALNAHAFQASTVPALLGMLLLMAARGTFPKKASPVPCSDEQAANVGLHAPHTVSLEGAITPKASTGFGPCWQRHFNHVTVVVPRQTPTRTQRTHRQCQANGLMLW